MGSSIISQGWPGMGVLAPVGQRGLPEDLSPQGHEHRRAGTGVVEAKVMGSEPWGAKPPVDMGVGGCCRPGLPRLGNHCFWGPRE